MEKGFYHPDIGYWQAVGGNPSPDDYQAGTIEIPLKPSENHHWQNDEWVYVEPEPEPEAVITIPAVTFWERTTEAEGTAIETMLNQQPFRVRQIFMTAQSYRSDHELWPLLQSAAIGLFGETRAAELLASP
ncbi:hypothetical protein HBA92_00480 [Ochrobactrum sp. MR28]|nr:hypothetical protein [Ochrobactrum sp. MR28]MBX8814739.1 hypothetical protein [Ochrobactrum sp. MR31]